MWRRRIGSTSAREKSGSMTAQNELQTVAVVVAMVSFVMLPVFLVGALSLQMREDIAITPAQFGLVASVFFLMSAVASLPVGRLAQRWGAVKSLRAAALTAFGGYLAIGLVVQTWRGLFISLGVVGCANAMVHPAGNLAIARGVSTARGLAFGVKQAAVPTATLIAGAAVPVAALYVPWRVVFIVVGLGTVITAMLASVITETPAPVTPQGRPANAAVEPGGLVLLPLIMVAIGGGLGAAAVNAFSIFFVPAAVSIGWEEISAGRMLFFSSLIAIFLRVAIGRAADRLHSDGILGIVACTAVGAVTFFTMGFSQQSAFFATVLIVGFAIGWSWQGLFQFTVALKNGTQTAVATSIAQAGVWVGGVLGPLSFGAIADRYGFTVSFFIGAALQLAAIGFFLYAKRRYRLLGI